MERSVSKAPPARFPETEVLTAGLGAMLGVQDLQIRHRVPAIWASTHPSEVVTCELPGSTELKLHCKYAAGLHYESFGHRGGLPYEIEVYRRVLSELPIQVPRFYGGHKSLATDDVWLVLEYLDGPRVTKGPQPASIVEAARWLGRFHAAAESRLHGAGAEFLTVYDASYYLGWSRRTLQFAHELRSKYWWLETLCDRFQDCIEILLSSPRTIIHGEFYPHNILLRAGQIYPIDWESASIASGEIDLAMLTEAWNPVHRRQCEAAYRQVRWGAATPPGFQRRLAAARLYLCFRWMGEQREWTVGAGNRDYFERMRLCGEELGLIQR
jgi:hypothetical protein